MFLMIFFAKLNIFENMKSQVQYFFHAGHTLNGNLERYIINNTYNISINMINIGRYNQLKINRMVDFGAYLDMGDDKEVLMPAKYLPEQAKPGDIVDAFVYPDSEDRLVATTEHPFALVGEFAFLQVAEVNKVGAFLDWGLPAKHLLVPFAEQRMRMRAGGVYLVYVYLDDASKRIVASSKIDKFLGNVLPHYKIGDPVKALVYDHTDIGYKCIVDNLHHGMIYHNELHRPLELQQTVTACVKKVRDDDKIDLTLGDVAQTRTGELADVIIEHLKAAGGSLPLCDKTSPDTIQRVFGVSKKDFKKALGRLYKERLITIGSDSISLC